MTTICTLTYSDITFVDDPHTDGGFVSRTSIPKQVTSTIQAEIAEEGAMLDSWAPDVDDPSQLWLYLVPVAS